MAVTVAVDVAAADVAAAAGKADKATAADARTTVADAREIAAADAAVTMAVGAKTPATLPKQPKKARPFAAPFWVARGQAGGLLIFLVYYRKTKK